MSNQTMGMYCDKRYSTIRSKSKQVRMYSTI